MNTDTILNAAVGTVMGTAIWLSLVVSLTALGFGDWVWAYCDQCLVALAIGGGTFGVLADALRTQPRH
ncbi:MAG: hypothetical protein ACFCUJ_16295 [Thiotrichales bacterium]